MFGGMPQFLTAGDTIRNPLVARRQKFYKLQGTSAAAAARNELILLGRSFESEFILCRGMGIVLWGFLFVLCIQHMASFRQ